MNRSQICRSCRNLTIRIIPNIFGGRDHSTVLHAVRKIEELINRRGELAVDLFQRNLRERKPHTADYRLESEIMEYLRRMYYFAKRIAKVVDEEELPSGNRRVTYELIEPISAAARKVVKFKAGADLAKKVN